MASATKVIGISALVALGIWGAMKLTKTGMDAAAMLDTFDIELGISNFRISDGKIKMKLNVSIINPSDFSITIKKPYVEVYLNEPGKDPYKIISTSTSNQLLDIAACTKSPMEYDIEISLLSFVNTFGRLLSVLIQDCNFNDLSFTGLLNIGSKISQNIDKLYPMLSVKVLTAWKDVPVNKDFTLA